MWNRQFLVSRIITIHIDKYYRALSWSPWDHKEHFTDISDESDSELKSNMWKKGILVRSSTSFKEALAYLENMLHAKCRI